MKISMLKMIPYINVDPGTMSPTQHGEVLWQMMVRKRTRTWVNMRFTSLTLSKDSNFRSGQIYLQVIENEREGKYSGKCGGKWFSYY